VRQKFRRLRKKRKFFCSIFFQCRWAEFFVILEGQETFFFATGEILRIFGVVGEKIPFLSFPHSLFSISPIYGGITEGGGALLGTT